MCVSAGPPSLQWALLCGWAWGSSPCEHPLGACQCAPGLAGSGPALRGSGASSTGQEAWHLLHPATPPPQPPPRLPETPLQLCFPEGSREPRKGAPWGSGLGQSLLEERLYKAIVGNPRWQAPCSWHASDPGAWLPAFAWTGKRGQQLATEALSWLGTMCQGDRGPLGASSGRTEGPTSNSAHGGQLCMATGAGWHGLRSPLSIQHQPRQPRVCRARPSLTIGVAGVSN